MAELRDAGAVGFSDDGLPVRSARILRRALQYQRLCGGVIALHEEDPELSGDGVMHEGPVSAALGLAGIPSISESTMIARDAALAGYEEARIHVQHLSARGVGRGGAGGEGRRACRSAARRRPHHLCLTDEAVRSLDARRFKMNPPLRAEEDRQALIEGLRDGTIDCIATDHAPHSTDEKEVPFEEAAMGVTGLETAFAALHTDLVLAGRARPRRCWSRSSAPARSRSACRAPALAAGQRGQPRPLRPRRPSGRSARTATRAARHNCWCAGRGAAGPGADDRRRRPGRLPAAQLLAGGGLA